MGIIGRLVFPQRQRPSWRDRKPGRPRFDVTSTPAGHRPALLVVDKDGRPKVGLHIQGVGQPDALGIERVGFLPVLL